MLRALFLTLLLGAGPVLAQDVLVQDAYAITTVPGAPTGAAYMVIRNAAATPDRLLGASSPAAEQVQLHTHLEEDGILRMRPVEGGLELPAGGELLLARGGAHLMFTGISDPFVDGVTVPVTLVFERGGEVRVVVPVDLARLTGDAGAHAQESHDHGAHEH